MRYFFLSLLFVWTSVLASPTTVETVSNLRPINGSHVSDPDNLIGPEATEKINRLLVSLERDTGAQVAVVAVESIGKADVFSFAQALFDRWGIGDQKRDDGLLVLLVRDQRTIRMHTGYGLEGSLPDVVCKRIEHDYMVPAFKEGRYGDGLLAGLNAVAWILSNPGSAEALTPAPPKDNGWFGFKLFISIAGGSTLFIVLLLKFIYGGFSVKTTQKNGIPVSMHWTAFRWLLTFAGGPVFIVTVVDLIRMDSPILVTCGALYGYFMLVAGVQAWRQHRAVQHMSQNEEYFESYALISGQQSFWLRVALLFPVPFLAHYLFLWRRKVFFRKHPRNCPACKAAMRRLSEVEEDDHLSKAQQMEETLHSADHDIWRCTACETSLSIAYPNQDTIYKKCSRCKALTHYVESTQILIKPTRSRHGKGETVHICKFCGHKKIEKYSIAKLGIDNSSANSSDNSSSSRTSSSGGSSWGGGSSGGGGASSSW